MAIIPNDEKVIMVSSTANTTYSGSKALKETAEWYTMQDITDTVAEGGSSYKVYTALLTQTGTDAPVAIVLENTIGDIVWSRIGSGSYLGTLSESFGNEENCYINIPSSMNRGDDTIFSAYRVFWNNSSEIGLETWQIENSSPFSINDFNLDNTPIEIRVYN